MTTVDDNLLPGAAECERLLDKARSLAAGHAFGPPLHQLVDIASRHLDSIDVRLLALHPLLHAPAFATAARLQRRLEQVQAAIPPPARVRPNRDGDRHVRARTLTAPDRGAVPPRPATATGASCREPSSARR